MVTIATDSYDRYPSVSRALYVREGGQPSAEKLEMWAKSVFLGASLGEIIDLNSGGHQQRLQHMKEDLWPQFGYDVDSVRRMASQEFWDAEYEKIAEIDPLIEQLRENRTDAP